MTKKLKSYINICAFLLIAAGVYGQDMIVTAFIPPGALIQKEQLWNMTVSNPTKNPLVCQVSLTVLNKANGQKMMTALSNSLIIPSGARQIQTADVMPVMYNALSNEVNLSGYGFLPVGLYQVCYELVGFKGSSYGSTCVDAQVDVLAPPQLIFPENKSDLKEQQPSFSWLPPAPLTLVRNCTYEYKIVKINSNQTSAEAIRDNVPVYKVAKLSNTMLTYPAFATALEKKQLYAWQITAQTSTADLKSDVWTFSISENEQPKVQQGDGIAFTKLSKKNENVSYSVVAQTLRFSYLNEGLDSVFQIRVLDVTNGSNSLVQINEKAIPIFSPGVNLVEMNLPDAGKFMQNHMYELSLIDTQGQEWRMLFEYRGKKK